VKGSQPVSESECYLQSNDDDDDDDTSAVELGGSQNYSSLKRTRNLKRKEKWALITEANETLQEATSRCTLHAEEYGHSYRSR
jgi:uncharacterized membrane protein YdfJ with MMPL/SSD domain